MRIRSDSKFRSLCKKIIFFIKFQTHPTCMLATASTYKQSVPKNYNNFFDTNRPKDKGKEKPKKTKTYSEIREQPLTQVASNK